MAIVFISDPSDRSCHQIDAPTIEKAIESVIDIIVMELSELDVYGEDPLSNFCDRWDTGRLIIQVRPDLEMRDGIPAGIFAAGSDCHPIVKETQK